MRSLVTICMIMILISTAMFAQKHRELAWLENKLQDFTLSVYQGGEFTLSNYEGKNILLHFPRGYYDKDIWCDICAYQYLDLVNENEVQNISEKYNLEIVVVLPYDRTTIDKWLYDMPEVYKSLNDWKFIDPDTSSEAEIGWSNYVKQYYPKNFSYEEGSIPIPFKILVDEKHELSERLGIFRTEWWGTEVDQNLPTTIILDTTGKVIFKYISQYTLDRPSTEYLVKIIDAFLK